MTGRILTCACCGEPLQVVCPTHGTETVARSWPAPPRASQPSRAPIVIAPTDAIRAGTVRARVLEAISDRRSQPTSIAQIVQATGCSYDHATVELTTLSKRKLIERVGRGLYVRTEGVGA